MTAETKLLVAVPDGILQADPRSGSVERARVSGRVRPTALAADPWTPGRAWCGTRADGVLWTEDGGATWHDDAAGPEGVTALAADPVRPDVVWAGTEPSALWCSVDGGRSWSRMPSFDHLPSSDEWAFPPRPDTHHVRWIACHPREEGRLWLAIEAGALIRTQDGGTSWEDRVAGGPRDTHELAVHRARPETLRVSAGDGYFESHDGGETWEAPRRGLEVGYLRSVAVDPGAPEVTVVSASSRAKSAYAAGHSDGRVYRREGEGPWERVTAGWPDPPATIAPLLRPGRGTGELWAADERGVHRSGDGGRSWDRVARFERAPAHLRGFEPLAPAPREGSAGG